VRALSRKALTNVIWYAAFIGVVVWLVSIIPLLTTTVPGGGMIGTLQGQGVSLMKSMFMADGVDLRGVRLPDGQFDTATQYLEALLEAGALDSLDGYVDARGQSRWCIIEGLRESPEALPWLFSTNLFIGRLDEEIGADDVGPLLGSGRGVVVVYLDRCLLMSPGDLAFKGLCKGYSNRVLRP
jgi:hypothetical protein